jgi:hypothetical protein
MTIAYKIKSLQRKNNCTKYINVNTVGNIQIFLYIYKEGNSSKNHIIINFIIKVFYRLFQVGFEGLHLLLALHYDPMRSVS